MKTDSIYNVTKDGYINYGQYINNNRHIPLLFDGLKPSYRRTIYAALQVCGNQNKFVKSAQLTGYVIGNLHPHSSTAIYGVICQLVNAGIFEGQGSFGGSTVTGDVFEPAAERYTMVRLDSKWHSIFNELLPYVEWEDSYTGMKMPSYLPTPIPLVLLFGSLGIGFGTGNVTPNFGAKSLIKAFKTNNPYELYPAYKNITFDYNQSHFEDLWDKGYSVITYIPKVYRGSTPDCSDGIFVETDTRLLIPDLPLIKDKVSQGRLYTVDLTDESGDRLFIGKYPRIQENMDYYVNYIKENCKFQDTFRLFVTDGKTTRLISLKNWLEFTYTRYLGYINKMKESKINRLTREIRICNLIPRVGKLIVGNPEITESEVISNLSDANPSDVKACLGKPIRKLMKSDYSNEIASLNNQIDQVNAINPESYTMDILNRME